jgi:hypothetical protein
VEIKKILSSKNCLYPYSPRAKQIHKYAKGLKIVEMRLCLCSLPPPPIDTQRRSYPILMFTE